MQVVSKGNLHDGKLDDTEDKMEHAFFLMTFIKLYLL